MLHLAAPTYLRDRDLLSQITSFRFCVFFGDLADGESYDRFGKVRSRGTPT